MSSLELLEPVLRGGIRSVNFFNGRLLTGEDLSAEQEANREARHRLGAAIGDGVAYGLEVSKASGASTQNPTVTIKSGLALNRKGQALKLSADTDITLVRQTGATRTPTASSSIFRECQQAVQASVFLSSTSGVYLLTMAPAEGTEGRVSTSGLGNNVSTCVARYTVEGVQFRLLQLNLTGPELSDTNRLRNTLAYKCFGTGVLNPNPFAQTQDSYGLLDSMRRNALTDYDVPLAVIYWTLYGISFIDLWSVRRRLTRSTTSSSFAPYVGDRRRSECEAMFLQFEEHLQEIYQEGGTNREQFLKTFGAVQRFSYLPSAGFLPISAFDSRFGFDPTKFFGARLAADIPGVSINVTRSMLQQSFNHEPINLSSSEKIQLFHIKERAQPNPNSDAQRVAFFASQTLVSSMGGVGVWLQSPPA